METKKRSIEYLILENGKRPFQDWIDSLENAEQAAIQAYIHRLAEGGSRKNVKWVGDGVFEIKIARGPGFRVYFSESGATILLLLLGGSKNQQSKDIALAKEYWSKYVQNRKL